MKDSYHQDMEGDGVVCSAVDIFPTEFAKRFYSGKASKHFGDILSEIFGYLASTKDIKKLLAHLTKTCIAHGGTLTPLYGYIYPCENVMTQSKFQIHLMSYPTPLYTCLAFIFLESSKDHASHHFNKKYTTLVSLSGHLFDQFLINEALNIIEPASGSFHLVKCQVGPSSHAMSYSELEVSRPQVLFDHMRLTSSFSIYLISCLFRITCN
ncbi:putative saccharopine dehydrogenase (NAD(+), L-glutamate-forming) [Rosa chinensis]|uniref:Putative saccharopine dehydrogenase (NAD(+), L-glutamate-forming) n=1 Tax=Rosa chinensis TaxID=74649 RepID=A0A2P6RSG6_ROSCH|nr:putative saccharopine dehydrogenase (NAD(+), L-glutamate-forming) [Rosa chinensis]